MEGREGAIGEPNTEFNIEVAKPPVTNLKS